MTVLALKGLSKFFGSVKAVNDLSLEVQNGEVFTLLGPSGCGKTTTLRLVAGLEEPDAGEIIYQGYVIVSGSKRLFTPPYKRNMGMVFQSYAVWPHMTVYENVAYPLRLRRISFNEARAKVQRVLELVGLGGLEDRPAPLLSGGQQQRVALARALVYEPALLLLDEPFSNLDAKLREQMRVEVKLLQKKLGITVLFVTHDQVEALSLSNRIAVMNQGGIEQVGSPSELYQTPKNPFVRDFLGKTLMLRGQIGQCMVGGAVEVTVDGIEQPLVSQSHGSQEMAPGQQVLLAIRPEDIVVNLQGTEMAGESWTHGVVEALLYVGDRYEVRVQLEGRESVLCYVAGRERLVEGQPLKLRFPEEVISIWPT